LARIGGIEEAANIPARGAWGRRFRLPTIP
jgi:hypothetical protein